MGNLVKAEFFKLSKLPSYKILIICCICTGIFFSAIIILAGSGINGYVLLTECIGMLLVNSIFGSIFTAFFIGNEFKNNTFGISLLSGYARQKLFIAKVIVFFTGFLQVLFIIQLTSVVIISFYNGFGMDFSVYTCQNILLLLLYGMAGYLAFGAVMVFIAMLARKELIIAIAGILLTYIYLFARTNFWEIPFLKYTFFYQIELMAFCINKNYDTHGEVFSVGTYFMVTILTFIVALVLSGWIFGKKELK